MNLNIAQERSLYRWRDKGSRLCARDALLQGPDASAAVEVVRRNGVWHYGFVGAEHTRINGVCLTGEVEAVVGPVHYRRMSGIYQTAIGSWSPHYVETAGFVGNTRNIWSRRISLPVSPPKGADAAVISIWDWEEASDPLSTPVLDSILDRYLCARTRAALTLRDKLKVTEDLLSGEFGKISSDHMIQLLLINMAALVHQRIDQPSPVGF